MHASKHCVHYIVENRKKKIDFLACHEILASQNEYGMSMSAYTMCIIDCELV